MDVRWESDLGEMYLGVTTSALHIRNMKNIPLQIINQGDLRVDQGPPAVGGGGRGCPDVAPMGHLRASLPSPEFLLEPGKIVGGRESWQAPASPRARPAATHSMA